MGSSSDRTALAVLAARSVPVTTAAARLVGVAAPLADLLPEGGLRRGSTVGVGGGRSGRSGVSLALALLSSASAAGAWCAAVALPDLGLVAAAELGVALERLALVPHPGDQWPMVVAALLESIDVVVVRPPERTRVADARRLAARARERGAVLVTLDGTGSRVWGWPEAVDVRLEVIGSTWSGLGRGYGYLQDRELEVTVTGRRGATRARTGRLYLPGGGGVHPAPGPVPAKGPVGRPAPAPAAQAG